MPISEMPDYPAAHWDQVRFIIQEALAEKFEARLVSDSPESQVIHRSIVENLAHDPIVVCDVSGKNPNVMFELGLRLAFDMPTVVIKDDVTSYSFDTGLIEHLGYPRSLNFKEAREFQAKLLKKVESTHRASKAPDYSTFLKNFKTLKPKTLPTETAEPWTIVQKQLAELRDDLRRKVESTQPREEVTSSVNKPIPIEKLEFLEFKGPEAAALAFAQEVEGRPVAKWIYRITFQDGRTLVGINAEASGAIRYSIRKLGKELGLTPLMPPDQGQSRPAGWVAG